METAITWKVCTSLRGAECDLLSDDGELELIGSRCGCVRVTYTCACRCSVRAGTSRVPFSHMLQPQQIWQHLLLEVLSSGSAQRQVFTIHSLLLCADWSLLHTSLPLKIHHVLIPSIYLPALLRRTGVCHVNVTYYTAESDYCDSVLFGHNGSAALLFTIYQLSLWPVFPHSQQQHTGLFVQRSD